ncbi:hypothetical protein K2173_009071 [Erythroxylum novogranatense]|uniref:RING-type domain-containing protein n=1 Tax=Erythroxylum novogranatense TaxID=1862640 RepID=A0AAV8TV79_9ROSI|nr:hypothetical protein K2173_009071 [Erythroxylum novogranatense]
MDGPPANDWCSVCHGHFNVPCQANCSHWFCGDCIMMVWQHGSAIQPCKCPLCRRQITLLVPGEASLRQRHNPQVAEVLGKIETYNRLFGGRSNGLVQRLQDLPFLIRRLVREMMDPQRSLPLVIRARVYISVSIICNSASNIFSSVLHFFKKKKKNLFIRSPLSTNFFLIFEFLTVVRHSARWLIIQIRIEPFHSFNDWENKFWFS